MSASNDKVQASQGIYPAVTLALISTYIADDRPEGDTLGHWAEIAQAFSIGSLIIAAFFITILFLAGVAAAMAR